MDYLDNTEMLIFSILLIVALMLVMGILVLIGLAYVWWRDRRRLVRVEPLALIRRVK